MNTRIKGRRNELKAKAELEKEGWLVQDVKGSTKWNKNVDFFGLFDLIAIKKPKLTDYYEFNNSATLIKFIQVKTNRKPPFKKYEEFKDKHCRFNAFVEVWVWFDREGFKRYII